jgi:hypothetical protein
LAKKKKWLKKKLAVKKIGRKKMAKIFACRTCLVAPYSKKKYRKKHIFLVLYIKFRALFSTIPQ